MSPMAMVTRYQRRSRLASTWRNIPAELRLLILDQILVSTSADTHRKSVLATVSKEWQQFFERANFERLVLHQNDVANLNIAVNKRRRDYVTWVWLRFELAPYECWRCEEKETVKELWDHDCRLTRAVKLLFNRLSKWVKKGDYERGKGGITFELSAHSPSDTEHHFKHLKKRVDDTAWSVGSAFGERRDAANDHGLGFTTYNQRARILGPAQGLSILCRALPTVPVVRSFFIRRQFQRCFSAEFTLRKILESFTQLVEFHYEPWRGLVGEGEAIRNEENEWLFSEILKDKPTLKLVAFYEDADATLHQLARYKHEPFPDLSKAFAECTYNYEEIHGALAIDATHFFQTGLDHAQLPDTLDLYWPNVRMLSLTSKELTPRGINAFLRQAAAAASQMPRLTDMELWNPGPKFAAAFFYNMSRRKQLVRLISSWNAVLEARTVESWKRMAGRRCSHPSDFLRWVRWTIKPRIVPHGQIVPWLGGMGDRMLTPASLVQMYREIGFDWNHLPKPLRRLRKH